VPLDPRSIRTAPLLALGAILIVFLVLEGLVATRTPAYEAADEPGHVQNIESLVRGHWYHIPPTCQLKNAPVNPLLECAGDEVQQAPLYYLALAAWQQVGTFPYQPPYLGIRNPGIDRKQAIPFFADDQSPNSTLLWLRFPNLFLGALTLLVAYFAARLVTQDRWTPVVSAAIVAFFPRFMFMSAFVTNDNLVNLLGAVLTFFALRFTLKPTTERMLLVGGTFGLLVDTKLSALPLGLVIIVLAFLRPGWKRRLEFAGVGFGSALVVCGWFLVQNTVRYGDPLAIGASSRYLTSIFGLGVLGPYRVTDPLKLIFVQVPQRIVNTVWYSSGWNQFRWPSWIDWAITVCASGALVGLVGRHIRRDLLIVLATCVACGLLCVWLVAFQTSTYVARYALVAICPFAILLAMALERWRLPIRLLAPMAGLVGTLVAIQMNVLSIPWT
jgi:hypothetical protein